MKVWRLGNCKNFVGKREECVKLTIELLLNYFCYVILTAGKTDSRPEASDQVSRIIQ